MAEHTAARWQDRLVQVPVWTLLIIGAAMVGGGSFVGLTMSDAQAQTPIKAEDVSEMHTYLVRIDGRLEGMERISATFASEMVALRREVNALRADVDAIQRGR